MRLLQKFLGRFSGKDGKQHVKESKEAIPEEPAPRLQIRTIEDLKAATAIKTYRDVKAFCEEVRKTLRICKKSCQIFRDTDWTQMKHTFEMLYVEVGNLSKKVDRLIELIEEGRTEQ